MKRPGEARFLIVLGFLLLALLGGIQTANRVNFGLSVDAVADKVIVHSVKAGGAAAEGGVQPGDQIAQIDGKPIQNAAQATWLTLSVLEKRETTFKIIRNGEPRELILKPKPACHPFFIVINILLGLSFITTGLMVKWGGKSDATTRSFHKLTLITGAAILLYSFESTLEPALLRHIYALAWFATNSLIYAALLEFLILFTGLSFARIYKPLFYGFMLLAALTQFSLYLATCYSSNPQWIARFDWTLRIIFGAVQTICFLIALTLILRAIATTRDRAQRGRLQWLLIVTAIGLMPYFLLYKFPMALGLGRPIPVEASLALMLITPVGWGMAVASFRMLNLEWVFSRTIIYVLAAVLSMYVLLILIMLLGESYAQLGGIPNATLAVVGLLIFTLGSAGLISPMRHLVDSIYYHDWFNLRETIRSLGNELSHAVDEATIQELLCKRLPEIMKIEKVTLLIGDRDSLRAAASNEDNPQTRKTIIEAAHRLVEEGDRDLTVSPLSTSAARLSVLNYARFIPLFHGGVVRGALLIGRKKSQAPFSAQDETVLDFITAPAGTALAHLSLTRWVLDQEKRSLAADMAGGIAHEINNALSPLMGQAQLMEARLASQSVISQETLIPALEVIVMMCDRIKRIASNLTRLSQPPQVERKLLTLESVAEDCINIMSETAGRIKHFKEGDPAAPFKLVRELDAGAPPVMGDAQQLGMLMLNLMVNAADALAEKGSGTMTVGVRAKETGGGAVGYVADDGPGMSFEIQQRIFQPYFTTKSKGKGTGLGLAIVRQIAESHGGWIQVQSTPGVGTRFEFFIPAAETESAG